MDFNKIIGQKEIVNRLKKLITDNKIGHAFIFTGTKGIGKRTIGKAFAHMLLCDSPDLNGPCNKCTSCKLRIEGSNPDFYQIETEGDNISIDEIRNMQNNILIKPLYSSRKVILIVDAEKLTVQAQNCLLKVLEEPPQYAVIILTASNYEALLGTIRSRVSKFNLSKYTPEEMREIIIPYVKSETPDVDFIINYSDGIPGIALNLTASDDFALLREKAIDIIRKFDNMKDIEFFDIYDFFEASKNKIDIVLDVMTTFYRDLIVIKTGGKENMLINSDKKNKIVSEAGKYSIEKLINNIEVVETTRNSIKQNVNYQLSIETMILKLQG
jgi:DNA polymerase-3 subunit delta'